MLMELSFLFKVLLLTNFKHGPEDEECPVPETVRDTLGEFHNDLLLHCGEKFFFFFHSACVNGFYGKCFRLLMLNFHFTQRYTY